MLQLFPLTVCYVLIFQIPFTHCLFFFFVNVWPAVQCYVWKLNILLFIQAAFINLSPVPVCLT